MHVGFQLKWVSGSMFKKKLQEKKWTTLNSIGNTPSSFGFHPTNISRVQDIIEFIDTGNGKIMAYLGQNKCFYHNSAIGCLN